MGKRTVVGLMVVALALVGIKVAAQGDAPCVVNGSGASEGGLFGGAAATHQDLGSYGVWTFSTSGGDHFAGTVHSVHCESRQGERIASWSGSVSWNGKGGYSFGARAVDGADDDTFSITIRDSHGRRVYGETGAVRLGDLTIRL